jgi:hypothetical protein
LFSAWYPTTNHGSSHRCEKPSFGKMYPLGAHPDDEGFDITAFGQWAENYRLQTGVVTPG